MEVLNLKEVARILASPGRDMITGWVEVFQTPEKSEEGGTAAKKSKAASDSTGVPFFCETGWWAV